MIIRLIQSAISLLNPAATLQNNTFLAAAFQASIAQMKRDREWAMQIAKRGLGLPDDEEHDQAEGLQQKRKSTQLRSQVGKRDFWSHQRDKQINSLKKQAQGICNQFVNEDSIADEQTLINLAQDKLDHFTDDIQAAKTRVQNSLDEINENLADEQSHSLRLELSELKISFNNTLQCVKDLEHDYATVAKNKLNDANSKLEKASNSLEVANDILAKDKISLDEANTAVSEANHARNYQSNADELRHDGLDKTRTGVAVLSQCLSNLLEKEASLESLLYSEDDVTFLHERPSLESEEEVSVQDMIRFSMHNTRNYPNSTKVLGIDLKQQDQDIAKPGAGA